MRLLLLVMVVLVIVVVVGKASPQPGHMAHSYYKCDSEFYRESLQCREEATRKAELEVEGRRRRLASMAGREEGGWAWLLLPVMGIYSNMS